jgi:arginyl-tRNA synthetase
MIDTFNDLNQLIRDAVERAFGPLDPASETSVRRSEHADYQVDVALALARKLRRNPKDVALDIIASLGSGEILENAVVSGPGFINLTCRSEYLAAQLGRMHDDARLAVDRARSPQTVIVDYSSPNLAKEMHVGHLRSTVIGDCLARTLEYLGHSVLRQNHIGDWGTPFGMLIEQMLDEGITTGAGDVNSLSAFYRAARVKFDADPAFAERARGRVVLLQRGDPVTLELWRRLIDVTAEYIDALYTRLHIKLGRQDMAGESRYNSQLDAIVSELERMGIARTSDAAVCVFPPGFTGRDGKPLPLIVRKQDGAFGYATTDLAALKYRVETLGAERIIYVVGAPQNQHFAMVFATARLAGWVSPAVRLEHVAFGSVLGEDGKVLKTRTGEAVSLATLVEEAVTRAQAIVDRGSSGRTEGERASIAEMVGIGAVKYADLANDRIRDYIFSWNRMLNFEGNTAPYLMYAHARIRSILRKAQATGADLTLAAGQIRIDAPAERALALELLEFPDSLIRVGETLQPHRLCQHLFQVATVFTRFYDACPVLNADARTSESRLVLCSITARVLEQGMALLGIEAPLQM